MRSKLLGMAVAAAGLVGCGAAGAQDDLSLLGSTAAEVIADNGTNLPSSPRWIRDNADNGLLPSDQGYELVPGTVGEGTSQAGSVFRHADDGLGVRGRGNPAGYDVRCPSLLTMAWFQAYTRPVHEQQNPEGLRGWLATVLSSAVDPEQLPWGFSPVDFDRGTELTCRLGGYTNASTHLESTVFPRLQGLEPAPETDSPWAAWQAIQSAVGDQSQQAAMVLLASADGQLQRLVLVYKVADCRVRPYGRPDHELAAKACFVMDLDPRLAGWNQADAACLIYFPDRGPVFSLERTYRQALDRLAGGEDSWQRGHVLAEGQVRTSRDVKVQ